MWLMWLFLLGDGCPSSSGWSIVLWLNDKLHGISMLQCCVEFDDFFSSHLSEWCRRSADPTAPLDYLCQSAAVVPDWQWTALQRDPGHRHPPTNRGSSFRWHSLLWHLHFSVVSNLRSLKHSAPSHSIKYHFYGFFKFVLCNFVIFSINMLLQKQHTWFYSSLKFCFVHAQFLFFTSPYHILVSLTCYGKRRWGRDTRRISQVKTATI